MKSLLYKIEMTDLNVLYNCSSETLWPFTKEAHARLAVNISNVEFW